MPKHAQQLREDALAIWRAGVDAVAPERLLPAVVHVDGPRLTIGEVELDLRRVGRIAVVGGGKAGAKMAIGLERALGEAVLREKRVGGRLSVPADSVADTQAVRLVAGRPAGVNEPRPEGMAAAEEMLRIAGELGDDDLCLCLLSGGGSALLPLPVDGISLDEKIAVTRLLSAAGATIEQLNAVRKRLSRIKGGGLARACRAGRMITLIVSDVLGDPLDVIASGPTVPNEQSLEEAIAVFERLGVTDRPEAAPVLAALRRQQGEARAPERLEHVTNIVIANNATAVDAAGMEAERRGYQHAMTSAAGSEGAAEGVGRDLAAMAVRMRERAGPDCLISGGEPTVTLADEAIRGRGGRNQQLVLAALGALGGCDRVALLSGGTDGEDGPTDAAGAVIDEEVAARAQSLGLSIEDALHRNDAYTFFEHAGGLLKTGPTGANVCDVRVVTVDASRRAKV